MCLVPQNRIRAGSNPASNKFFKILQTDAKNKTVANREMLNKLFNLNNSRKSHRLDGYLKCGFRA